MAGSSSQQPVKGNEHNISGEASYRESFFVKLNDMRKAGVLCDVNVTAEGGRVKFPAHRVVLSAGSAYFHKLYTGTCLSRYCRETVLGGITEEILEIILEYLYTSEIELRASNVTSFLHASFYLEIDAVKSNCEAHLLQQLNVDNCIELMTMGKRYACTELLKKAKQTIGDCFIQVRSSEAFLKLAADHLREIIEDDDLDIQREEQVYEAVAAWVTFDQTQRSEDFPDLLRCIRLPFLSRKFLGNLLDKDPLVASSQPCKNLVAEALTFKMAGFEEGDLFRGERNSKRWKTQLIETIAIIGGVTEGLRAAKTPNHCYDPRTNKWYSLTSLSASRLDFGLVKCNRWLYAIGGSSIDESMSIMGSVERFYPKFNRWEEVCSLRTARMKFEAVELNGKFYALGGILNTAGPQHVVECFDPESATWTPVRPPRQLRHTHSSVAFEGHLYVIGGISKSNLVLDTVEKYDPKQDKWSAVTALSTPRSGACAVVLQQNIYVLGGSGKRGAMSSCEVYDKRRDKWTSIKDMNAKRDRAGAAKFDGKIYVFGGSYGNIAVDSVECFDPSKSSWELVTDLPCARHGFRSVTTVVSKEFVEELAAKRKPKRTEKLI